MGRSFTLRCAACGTEADGFRYDCAVCSGVLLVDPESVRELSRSSDQSGIWAHQQLLPSVATRVTLGEGGTPTVELDGIDWVEPSIRLIAKLESLNPTLSFKDRGMALAASVAKDRGYTSLVVASTGNAAVSASAYAAAAGLDCTVIVGSASNAMRKLDSCRAYGADVREIDGDYSAAYAAAKAAESDTVMNVSTTYRNPLLAEGYRSVAVELVEQLGTAPDAVIVPIGAGPFLRAIGCGFGDLRSAGVIDSVPRLVGVQAADCAPLARAWASGADENAWREALSQPFRAGPTSATAIADALRGYEDQGLVTLTAVRESGGEVVAVDEDEIASAERTLRSRGIWSEPSSATALAAVNRARLSELERVVLMVTGHGIKSVSPQG